MGTLTDFDLRQIRDRFRCRFLVETGTGRGGGVNYARQFDFDHIYSIEISRELATCAAQRFASHKHITILNADSEAGLRDVLARVPKDTPIVFWLDAHFPGADFGLAGYDSETDAVQRLPLQREMELIVSLRRADHDVFLIDDLRIYEDGPFEMGTIGNAGVAIPPDQRGIGFIERLFGTTHTIQRSYTKTGYVIMLPKKVAPAVREVSMAAARDALVCGNIDEAERMAEDIRNAAPTDANALILLAVIARRRRQFDQALTLLGQVVASAPGNAEAHANLGLVHQDLQHFDKAEAALRTALNLAPDTPEIGFNLARLLLSLGRNVEAAATCRRVLNVAPFFIPAHLALATALLQADDKTGAVSTLAQMPPPPHTMADDFIWIVQALAGKGTPPPPDLWKRALSLRPEDAALQLGHAMALGKVGQRDAALEILRRLAARSDATAAFFFELGKMFVSLDAETDAVAAYRHALAIDPSHAAANNNLAMILFLDGNFEEAWEHHEWRFEAKNLPRPHYPGPTLDNAAVGDRTLFLYGEQGLGDNIQFLRYAKILRQQGNRIVLGVRKELTELFKAQDYVDDIITDGETVPPFDFQLPLLSLPRLFRTRLDSVPADIPYLHLPKETLARWGKTRQWLEGIKGPRIGLVWAGNPGHHNDANRSIPTDLFLRLIDSLPYSFMAFQKPWPAGTPRPPGLVDLGTEFNDLTETAAALSYMDLVISVDTSVAHLAGALGRPVWLLLPTPCDWRWTRDGETTPWYPQMRLFRQRQGGNWAEVLECVRGELATLKSRGQ
jgi:Flp pilus assembly protein TadD